MKEIRRQIGRIPRGKAVPTSLRKKASDLAHQVVDESTRLSEGIDPDDLLKQQLSMRPTHLIAQEDFAVACLIALGLERETTGWPVEAFVRRNKRSIRLFKRVNDDPRCNDIHVYAVLSAMDYNTARAAGRLAARTGVEHAALGIAGINRDPMATDFYVMGKASHKLERPAPRRYVRLAQIIRGISDGYGDAGVTLRSFHALGLGAPVMFPILAAAADNVPALTTDATSPVHDAVRDEVLYDPERNGDRMSRVEIVTRIINGGKWPFSCPFCQAFREKFNHSDKDAMTWWEESGKPKIETSLLETTKQLAQAIPLFASPPGDMEKEALRAYVAHNHFVLGTLAEEFPDDENRRSFAMEKINELLGHQSLVTSRGLRTATEILTS